MQIKSSTVLLHCFNSVNLFNAVLLGLKDFFQYVPPPNLCQVGVFATVQVCQFLYYNCLMKSVDELNIPMGAGVLWSATSY